MEVLQRCYKGFFLNFFPVLERPAWRWGARLGTKLGTKLGIKGFVFYTVDCGSLLSRWSRKKTILKKRNSKKTKQHLRKNVSADGGMMRYRLPGPSASFQLKAWCQLQGRIASCTSSGPSSPGPARPSQPGGPARPGWATQPAKNARKGSLTLLLSASQCFSF